MFSIQDGTMPDSTFLPVNDKFVCSYCLKLHTSGLEICLESTFCFLMLAEVSSPGKVVRMLEEVVAWQWVVDMVNNTKLCGPIHSNSEVLICSV